MLTHEQEYFQKLPVAGVTLQCRHNVKTCLVGLAILFYYVSCSGTRYHGSPLPQLSTTVIKENLQ
jgi:hypothetical protein